MKLSQVFTLSGILLSAIILTPLWLWLLYMILDHIGATTTMWVVYWIYVPVAFVIGILSKLLLKMADDEWKKDPK
jgi:hypothetical protein